MKWIETVRNIAATIDAERAAQPPAPASAGWDPYEVWLNRVQAPREARRRPAAQPVPSPARELLPTT
jgi:uncharacterized membrane protein